MRLFVADNTYAPDPIQRIALGLMTVLTLLSFVGTNMQALLWQSSDWLVSTVLPAVVVDLTNEQRSDLSAAPLQRNTRLDEAARLKAQHMAENEYFAHYAPDGTTPWSFFSEAEYVFAHAGENLAIHFTDSTEVVEAWMDSPAHRKNIVDPKYTEIGVGTAKGTFDGYDTVYVVQLFGAPAVQPIPTPTAAPTPVSEEPDLIVEADTTDITDVVANLENIQAELDALDALVAGDTLTETDSLTLEEEVQIDVLAATQENIDITDPVVVQVDNDPVPVTEVALVDDTVVVSTELATSSGLAVASIVEPHATHAGATVLSVATKPSTLLNAVYTGIVTIIILLLTWALVTEARRLHVVQVAYSIALLLLIGGLWYMHTLLTNGAVIV